MKRQNKKIIFVIVISFLFINAWLPTDNEEGDFSEGSIEEISISTNRESDVSTNVTSVEEIKEQVSTNIISAKETNELVSTNIVSAKETNELVSTNIISTKETNADNKKSSLIMLPVPGMEEGKQGAGSKIIGVEDKTDDKELVIVDISELAVKVSSNDLQNEIIAPMNVLINKIDNLNDNVPIVNMDDLKMLSRKVDLFIINEIVWLDKRTSLAAILDSVINGSVLPERKTYFDDIKPIISEINKNNIEKINTLLEDLYNYLKLHFATSSNINSFERKYNDIKKNKVYVLSNSGKKLEEYKSQNTIKSNIIKELYIQFNGAKKDLVEVYFDLKFINEEIIVLKNNVFRLYDKLKTNSAFLKKEISKAFKDLMAGSNYDRGVYYFSINELEKAKDALNKEITENPDNWKARKYLAKIYTKEDKYYSAIKEINESLRLFREEKKIK